MMPIPLFWTAAGFAVLCALGTVLARKVVHSALCLCAMMVALGVLYLGLEAPFLFVAQILVYTGSVMMMFLFTMMLIGVDTRESLAETIKGQRFASVVAILALLALLVLVAGNAIVDDGASLQADNTEHGGNAQGLAVLLFTKYVFAFEAAAALVLTAALAAMVLASNSQANRKMSQRELAAERIREYAESGVSPTSDAGPGVYARANAIAYPALLPDGSIAGSSISPTLLERNAVAMDAPLLPELVKEAASEIGGNLPAIVEPVIEAPRPAKRESGEQ